MMNSKSGGKPGTSPRLTSVIALREQQELTSKPEASPSPYKTNSNDKDSKARVLDRRNLAKKIKTSFSTSQKEIEASILIGSQLNFEIKEPESIKLSQILEDTSQHQQQEMARINSFQPIEESLPYNMLYRGVNNMLEQYSQQELFSKPPREQDNLNKTYNYLNQVLQTHKVKEQKTRTMPLHKKKNKQSQMTTSRQTKDDIQTQNHIYKLRVQNTLLREKLKLMSVQLDQLIQEQDFSRMSKKQQEKQQEEAIERYLQMLEGQNKVNEKMIEQLVHEKAKLQLRNEQLADPNYVNTVIKLIEKAEFDIGDMKIQNRKLNQQQRLKNEELNKLQTAITNNKISYEMTLKANGEELQRTLWRIGEKERELKQTEEKQMTVMLQFNKVKEKHDQLKQQIEIKQQNEELKTKTRYGSYSPKTHRMEAEMDSGGTDTNEIQKYSRKLLADQWLKQSKINGLKNQVKVNDKTISDLQDQYMLRNKQIRHKTHQINILQEQIQEAQQILQGSTFTMKQYGFLASSRVMKPVPARNSNYQYRSASAETFNQSPVIKIINKVGQQNKPVLPLSRSQQYQEQFKTTDDTKKTLIIQSIKDKKQIYQDTYMTEQSKDIAFATTRGADDIYKSEMAHNDKTHINAIIRQNSFQISEIMPNEKHFYQVTEEDNSILNDSP